MEHDGSMPLRLWRRVRAYPGLRPAVWVVAGMAGSLVVLWAWWGFFQARADDAATAFDVGRLAIAGLAVMAVGGAGTLFFRHQVVAERRAASEAQRGERERVRDRRTERADLHARYQQAAGQLGARAPMPRIAGVYALEALAAEWLALGDRAQRDACLDLLCGYLRTVPEVTGAQGPAATPQIDTAEAEIRQTIAAVIARHLHDGKGGPGDWSDHDFSFSRGLFAHSSFAGGHFLGRAAFDHVRFLGDAVFTGAAFAGAAEFDNARFTAAASFDGATFAAEAAFNGATFGGVALFDGASFPKIARFNAAIFLDEAWFERTTFGGGAGFDGATFHGEVSFNAATFSSVALFDNSRFAEATHFDNATFTDKTRFSGASMARGVPPELVQYAASVSGAPVLTDSSTAPTSPGAEPRH